MVSIWLHLLSRFVIVFMISLYTTTNRNGTSRRNNLQSVYNQGCTLQHTGVSPALHPATAAVDGSHIGYTCVASMHHPLRTERRVDRRGSMRVRGQVWSSPLGLGRPHPRFGVGPSWRGYRLTMRLR